MKAVASGPISGLSMILPWLIAVLTLIPLYKVIFLYSRNLPQENWTTYLPFSNGIISQSWLWFLPVLFLFNILYLLFSRSKIRLPGVSPKSAVFGTFLVGFVYRLSMDIFGFQGWTKIGVLDFQNERLLIYFMVFLLGALCFRSKAFDIKPGNKTLYIIVNSLAWIPVTVYIFFPLYPWFKPGQYIISAIVHKLILWFSFQLSLFCLVYAMIETFRRYLNKQGRLGNELNKSSYYVYIIHVIVMRGFALLLLNSAMPSLLKYFTLVISTYGASNLIIYFCRRFMTPRNLRQTRTIRQA